MSRTCVGEWMTQGMAVLPAGFESAPLRRLHPIDYIKTPLSDITSPGRDDHYDDPQIT
jgi:hypothetical protein